MTTKNILLCTFLFAGVNLATAQQKYYAFSVNENNGITDAKGNEVVKPTYKYSSAVPAKNQIFFQNFSDVPDLVFNTENGEKQYFQSAYNNRLKIGGVKFSEMRLKDKRYLLSEESNKIINLKNNYSEFFEAGKYIIEKYEVTDYGEQKTSAPKKGKYGKIIPPPIMRAPEMATYFAVINNDEDFKTIFKGKFDSYQLLYKTAPPEKEDGIVKLEIIKYDHNERIAFDYIVFTKKQTHLIYDSKMTLIKSFVLAKADGEALKSATEKIVKRELSTSNSSAAGFKSAPPMAGVSPSSGRARSQPKIDYPYFYVKELSNGKVLFARQETEQISNYIFEAPEKSEVYLNKSAHTISLKLANGKKGKFSFDAKNGNIYLPASYISLLGLKIF